MEQQGKIKSPKCLSVSEYNRPEEVASLPNGACVCAIFSNVSLKRAEGFVVSRYYSKEIDTPLTRVRTTRGNLQRREKPQHKTLHIKFPGIGACTGAVFRDVRMRVTSSVGRALDL